MAGLDAFGTTLARGDGEITEVFVAIANVTSLTPPGLTRDTYDVTAHDSTDGWREFIGGLKDAGDVSFDVNYDPADHDTLIGDFEDAAARNYELTFPDGSKWEFAGFLTGFEADAPFDDKLSASLTIKVTGKPVVTTA